MWTRIGWLVFSWLILLTASAHAQAPAPPTCDATWFKKPAGKTALAVADLTALCDDANAKTFETAVSACAGEKDRCVKARTAACAGATSTSFEELAQCYHAAGDPALVRRAAAGEAPLGTPLSGAEQGEAGAEGAAAAGAVSIIAQGVGDFLVQRAEQEVSLYAAAELQKALCEKYGDAYFPKSCRLLKEADEDGHPVGLGVLRRALVEDLRELPASVLKSVLARLSPEQKSKACALDVAYAFASGVLKEGTIVPLLEPNPHDDDHLKLRRYRVRFVDASASPPVAIEPCDATWNALRDAAKRLQEARQRFENGRARSRALPSALPLARGLGPLTPEEDRLLEQWSGLVNDLHDVLTGPAPKEASNRAVRAGVGLLKELMPAGQAAAFEEASAIAVALVEGDWIGIVGAVAAAEELGPVLLCRKDAEPCGLDKNARASLRLVGDVAAADSSEGVSAALERFAAPLGSWRRKYQGGLYLMANGYVGAKFAYEAVPGDARNGTALAPVLAVGLEFGGNIGSHGRLAVFAQALDLGNVSSVRLSEEDDPDLLHVEVAPDVVAAQLLAPGVFVSVAPWKAPFALLFGFDWVPELRTVGAAQESAWHVGGAFVVDTPLLEIAHE